MFGLTAPGTYVVAFVFCLQRKMSHNLLDAQQEIFLSWNCILHMANASSDPFIMSASGFACQSNVA